MARQVEASHAWLEYITSVQCTADIHSHDEQCGGYLLQFSFHDERLNSGETKVGRVTLLPLAHAGFFCFFPPCVSLV
jgi:hypothetical protein